MTICDQCGMVCITGEYHPFAACLMFEKTKSSTVTRSNLLSVVERSRMSKSPLVIVGSSSLSTTRFVKIK